MVEHARETRRRAGLLRELAGLPMALHALLEAGDRVRRGDVRVEDVLVAADGAGVGEAARFLRALARVRSRTLAAAS